MYDHRRTDWEFIVNKLLEINWRSEFMEFNSEAMYNKVCDVLLQVCARHTPGRTALKRHIIPRDRQILMSKRANLNNQITATSRNMERRRLEHLRRKLRTLNDSCRTHTRLSNKLRRGKRCLPFERIPNISTNMHSQRPKSENQWGL
jgi:hypothetical protein